MIFNISKAQARCDESYDERDYYFFHIDLVYNFRPAGWVQIKDPIYKV